MGHLVRAGLLVAGLLTLIMVVPSVVSVPAELEAYGFYPKSSAKNTEEWASLPINYVENTICNDCHEDNFSLWKESGHNTVSCETCHGPGIAHIETGVKMEVDNSREFCGLCHASTVARPSEFPQVVLDEHGGQSSCVSCHNPHSPLGILTSDKPSETPPEKEEAKSVPAVPHSLDGREECLLCHGAGGMKPYPQNHEGRGQDTCLSCHQSDQE